MSRVITYGTFDLLHVGHVRLLKRAKELGDHLTVAVSSDLFNNRKNKKSFFSFEDRCEMVSALGCVDAVIPENDWEQKKDDIERLRIDTFVMGSDWEGKFDELGELCRVVYLPRTDGISSTHIRDALKGPQDGRIDVQALENTVEALRQLLSSLR